MCLFTEGSKKIFFNKVVKLLKPYKDDLKKQYEDIFFNSSGKRVVKFLKTINPDGSRRCY